MYVNDAYCLASQSLTEKSDCDEKSRYRPQDNGLDQEKKRQKERSVNGPSEPSIIAPIGMDSPSEALQPQWAFRQF